MHIFYIFNIHACIICYVLYTGMYYMNNTCTFHFYLGKLQIGFLKVVHVFVLHL